MSRFLLLFLFLIWMAWRADPQGQSAIDRWDITLFFGFYAFLVAALGVWSRLLARRVSWRSLQRTLKYFNRTIFYARLAVPIWFAAGVFFLGWGSLVQKLIGPVATWPVQLPAVILGTLPPLLTWIGLWWAQFPADRALREQNLLAQLDADLPIHAPPGFASYFAANLRLQVLFTAVPILLIFLLHDVMMMILWGAGLQLEGSAYEGVVTLAGAITIFVLAPLILRRVLHTQPLPDSPLRRRLEMLCDAHRLKYRDILLWRTEHNMGNAAVMGIAPPVRFILLSDLLLETMSDEQIEAVFAHEVGHVVHRHMIWYIVFMKILILALAAVGLVLEPQIARMQLPSWLPLDLFMMLLGFGGFLLLFGFVSRKFERQADVFAARTLEGIRVSGPEAAPEIRSHVGQYGATLFASALQRVAVINNIPVGARSWCHGSIANRMRYLHRLSHDPRLTDQFDRFMSRMYVGLIVALLISGVGALVMNIT